MSRILVTGGTGYIGSHACVELIRAGHEVTVLDNLSNSSPESLRGVERITGVRPALCEVDLCEPERVREVIERVSPEAVVHFAGLKYVSESVRRPLLYYRNNVTGSINLFKAMEDTGVRRLVFSSSCTVYGQTETVPIRETAPAANPANPYGRTKLMIEDILKDLYARDPRWSVAVLRYFNPVGAHASGLIGEHPRQQPENLMPRLVRVARGLAEQLEIWGGDYPTPDGTGIRDYIHVVDLAEGHVAALDAMPKNGGHAIYNLGTGKGHSVIEVVQAFERATGKRVPYAIRSPRPGDIARIWADCEKAARELGWKTTRNLDTACADAWRWECRGAK